MSPVRGFVLMSRLEYFEMKYGAKKYREFLKIISVNEINFSRQTVDGSLIYPDITLATIDQVLLKDYFDDLSEFRELGRWSAENFMYRFFSLYVEDSKPLDFLAQYARLRDYLVGSGEMTIHSIDENSVNVITDFGQTIPKSVCLSEQGFLQSGMEQCGASNIKINEKCCASDSETFTCEFNINFDSIKKENFK